MDFSFCYLERFILRIPDSQIDSLPISTCVALAREVASLVDGNYDDAEMPVVLFHGGNTGSVIINL